MWIHVLTVRQYLLTTVPVMARHEQPRSLHLLLRTVDSPVNQRLLLFMDVAIVRQRLLISGSVTEAKELPFTILAQNRMAAHVQCQRRLLKIVITA